MGYIIGYFVAIVVAVTLLYRGARKIDVSASLRDDFFDPRDVQNRRRTLDTYRQRAHGRRHAPNNGDASA